jgi:hypothetical protein
MHVHVDILMFSYHVGMLCCPLIRSYHLAGFNTPFTERSLQRYIRICPHNLTTRGSWPQYWRDGYTCLPRKELENARADPKS